MSRPKLLSLFFAVFLIFIGITANLWASGSAPGQPLPFPTRPKVVDEARSRLSAQADVPAGPLRAGHRRSAALA